MKRQGLKTGAAKLLPFIFVAALGFLAAINCSLVNLSSPKKEPPVTNEPATEPAPAEIKNPSGSKATSSVSPEAQEALAAGDFPKALEVYEGLLQKNSQDLRVQSEYIAAVERVKKESDSAKKRGKYSTALSGYQLLLQKFESFAPLAQTLSFRPNDLRQEIKECRLALQKNEAEQALKAKQYEKALSLLASSVNEYPDDVTLSELLNQTLTEIKTVANKARETNDYGTAGRLYSLLKTSWRPQKNQLAVNNLNIEEIEKAIKECSRNLTNLGLIEYRKGNLKEALAVWEQILVFEPDNEEIKKAIQTARAQLEKIKK